MKSRIEKTRTDETADIDIEQVRKAWSRKMTDDVHDEMRTFAIMAHSFIQVAHLHVKRINEWAVLDGQSLSRVHPIIESIGYLLNILVGEGTITATENINLAIKIINNILTTSTFTMQ